MENIKVLVLGYFGYPTNRLNGQTVKTRDLLVLFQRHLPNTMYIDTEEISHNKNIINSITKLFKCNIIAYLPAQRNLSLIFPLLFIFSTLFKKKIHYFVIGGWLTEFLSHRPVHRWMLKRICNIYTETQTMKKLLESSYNITNVDTFPNFRITDFKPKMHHENNKLRLVFMARIERPKGIDSIFELAEYTLSKYGNNITIDFYGPIEPPDENYFKENLARHKNTQYKGIILPQNIHQTLVQYDVMLLPTHYYTEGLPGTIVDSYISGIPVIVSKWKHATEFVKDGISGYIIPFENHIKQLIEKIDFLYQNPLILENLKIGSLKESENYTVEKAWKIISKNMKTCSLQKKKIN